ncbi:hypothetical protein PGTUg99_029278 [Puccinia graminis f. sp. tritici]|uniref:Uncharacterized protein n=1 Tax=Puccinia graminis f. sp. tritici TaxID=56615 RepID=A0A5B0PNW8_PUCGR|nr:hypothetical protein PGTUg99_029278 [Puccinia graminis f. sp. tritici]
MINTGLCHKSKIADLFRCFTGFGVLPTGFQGLLSQYALSHQGPLRGRNGPDLAVNSAAVGQTVSEQSSDSQPNLDIPYAAEPIGQELSDPLLKLSDRQITNIRCRQ